MAEHDHIDILSQQFESGRISRRRFIQLLAVAAGAIPLAACGPTTATPPATTAPGAVTNPQSTAAPATPKKGGTLKYGLSTDPPNMVLGAELNESD